MVLYNYTVLNKIVFSPIMHTLHMFELQMIFRSLENTEYYSMDYDF